VLLCRRDQHMRDIHAQKVLTSGDICFVVQDVYHLQAPHCRLIIRTDVNISARRKHVYCSLFSITEATDQRVRQVKQARVVFSV